MHLVNYVSIDVENYSKRNTIEKQEKEIQTRV